VAQVVECEALHSNPSTAKGKKKRKKKRIIIVVVENLELSCIAGGNLK
jgi:hypothetical protein